MDLFIKIKSIPEYLTTSQLFELCGRVMLVHFQDKTGIQPISFAYARKTTEVTYKGITYEVATPELIKSVQEYVATHFKGIELKMAYVQPRRSGGSLVALMVGSDPARMHMIEDLSTPRVPLRNLEWDFAPR